MKSYLLFLILLSLVFGLGGIENAIKANNCTQTQGVPK